MTADPRQLLHEHGFDVFSRADLRPVEDPRVARKRWVDGILDDVKMLPGLFPDAMLTCEFDKRDPNGRLFIQVVAARRLDVYTDQLGRGGGGKAYLSPVMIESEVVQLCLGLIKAYFEHEVREHFTYKGRRVYGPHIDVNALWEVANRTVARPH